MQLKINLPYSHWEYKLSGVYRITFEDGTFYIGCSKHLRARASQWESIMLTGKGVPGREIGTNVINKIKGLQYAEMNIVEMCAVEDLKEREAFYLDKYKDDINMLSWEHGAWKPILQYTEAGVFVKKHFSQKAAARYNNTRLSAIQRVLEKARKSHKGMVYVYEYDYQARRKEIIRGRYKPVGTKKNGRKVLQYDLSGHFIAEYNTYRALSKAIGVSERTIRAALTGERKTAGGFVIKYSEPSLLPNS